MEISKKQLNTQVLNMVEKESWEGHWGHLCDDTQYESSTTGNVVRENCMRKRLRRRNRISYLSWCCEQTTVQNYFKKKRKGSLWLTAGGYRPSWWGKHGSRDTNQLVTPCTVRKQRGDAGHQLFFYFFLLNIFFACTHLPQQPLEDNFESWCFPSIMRVLQKVAGHQT